MSGFELDAGLRILPESIRWLIVNKKPEEARKIIERAARWNGVVIPERVFEEELVVIVSTKFSLLHLVL